MMAAVVAYATPAGGVAASESTPSGCKCTNNAVPTLGPKLYEPWCILLATTIYTLTSFPQEDIQPQSSNHNEQGRLCPGQKGDLGFRAGMRAWEGGRRPGCDAWRLGAWDLGKWDHQSSGACL